MDKILISVYALSLEEEYDIFLPISITIGDAIVLIQKTIHDLSEGNYVLNNQAILYSCDYGKVFNPKSIVKFSGLKNGCKVLLK